ncbi:MAG: hypothetical protein QXW35_05830 [Candidatus Aenigmatarchaeota archaeon]
MLGLPRGLGGRLFENNYVGGSTPYTVVLIDFGPENLVTNVLGLDSDYLMRELMKRVVQTVAYNPNFQVPQGRLYGQAPIYGPPILADPEELTITFLETVYFSPRDIFVTYMETYFDFIKKIANSYIPPEMQLTVHYYHMSPDFKGVFATESFYGCYVTAVSEGGISYLVDSTELSTTDVRIRPSLYLQNCHFDYLQLILDELLPELQCNNT